MNKALFTPDETNSTLIVERTFNVPVEKVWVAWTTKEMLEQWWGPQPWKAVTESFDFREGGHWHYYMLGPEGEKHWSWVDYLSIDPGKSFSAFDGFCDEQGVKDPNMPANDWHNEFVPMGERTRVIVTLTFKSADDLQKIVEMGFKEGFTMCLDQLEELLG